MWGSNINLSRSCFSGYVKALLGGLFICMVMAGPALGQAAFPETARKILEADSIQKELPCITDKETNEDCRQKEPVKIPGWLKTILKAIANFIAFIFEYLLYFLVAIGVIFIVYTLFQKFNRGKEKSAHKIKSSPGKLNVQHALKLDRGAPPTLGDADSLAEKGDFSAAVHLLLLAGIDVLQRKIRDLLVISDTSRDILTQEKLSPPERDLLRPLIEHVEVSLFAGRDLTGEEYDLCRGKYIALKEGAV